VNWDLLETLRLATLALNVVFMVLFPFLMALRFEVRPWQLWAFVVAVEFAWLGDCIQIVRRIIHNSPWDWFVSPVLLVSGILAAAIVLIPGTRGPPE
jgi:hypothetical protein